MTSQWLLTVPRTVLGQVGIGVGLLKRVILTGLNKEPLSLLEEWRITNLYIPVLLANFFAAGEEQTAVLNIYRNGDLVFTQAQTAKSVARKGGGFLTSVTFAADLQNPIVLERGQHLELEIQLRVNTKFSGGFGNEVIIGEEAVPGPTAEELYVPRESQAILSYVMEHKSGHVVLS